METNSTRNQKLLNLILTIVCICMAIFQFYSAAYKPFTSYVQRPVHLMFSLVIMWLVFAQKQNKLIVRLFSYAMSIISVLLVVYLVSQWEEIAYRLTSLTTLDLIVGVGMIVMVMIAVWQSVSIWMMLVAGLFLLYAYFGPMMTGIFRYAGITLTRALSSIVMSTEGIFGSTLAVSATYIYMFILFGDFLLEYGAGHFLIDLSLSAFGKFRGGSCKVAVVTSGLFGMVSGSGSANVSATGTFTIPLMTQRGYSKEFAGGLVAAAATGGLIMPPVMGSAAFIMANNLNIAYGTLCLYAAIPAVFYFLNLFIVADLEAVKRNDAGSDKSELPKGKEVFLEGWHYLICIFVLIWFLCVLRWSASKACVYSIVALLISDYARRIITKDKISIKDELIKLKNIAVSSSKGCVVVCMACAGAGIIVGVFSATGLSLRFSGILVSLAGGNILLLLILAMIGALILGMGMPSISVYILMYVIVVPALQKMGIELLSAHMFVFYFGILANITPPVGVTFYAAAGVAKSKPLSTGFAAWRLALPGFIVPFIFVYDPAIMLQGSLLEIIWVCFYAVCGMMGMAWAMEGIIGYKKMNPIFRVITFVFALCTIVPEMISTTIGLVGLAVMYVIVKKTGKPLRAPETAGQISEA